MKSAFTKTMACLLCALLMATPAAAAGGPVIFIPLVTRNSGAASDSPTLPSPAVPATRRTVNMPVLKKANVYEQMAIFWYGKVTQSDAYSDVRIAYDDAGISVIVATFDRLLWQSSNPTPASLTNWDAVSLFLRMDGADSAAPDDKAFRIDLAYNFSDKDPKSRAVYRGNGSDWASINAAIETQTVYRGDNPPNSGGENRGWVAIIRIPFSSLGVSRPAMGTIWRMGMRTYNRAAQPPAPISVTTWPENMQPAAPATWGVLRFGLPSLLGAASTAAGTVSIRRGLNNAQVIDANVGGYTVCGGNPSTFWTEWGERTWSFYNIERSDFNVQNQSDVADWPCFAKYYTVFPLQQVPAGKIIRSATLTLHQFGNAQPQDAKPSLLQVMTIDRDFDPNTVNWNNAPMALENVGRGWVDVLMSSAPPPGAPRTFDLSYAVAQAYAAGQPLRLVIYSASNDYHSGKYFVSSGTGDWNARGRPTLTIEWGDR